MNLYENKSRIWYKVLSCVDQPIDGSIEKWNLPKDELPGEWVEFESQLGTWLTSSPLNIAHPNNRIYVAEFDYRQGIQGEYEGLIWAKRVRLVRRVDKEELRDT